MRLYHHKHLPSDHSLLSVLNIIGGNGAKLLYMKMGRKKEVLYEKIGDR